MRVLLVLLTLGCGATSAVAQRTGSIDVEAAVRERAAALCEAGPSVVLGDETGGMCDAVEVRTAGEGDLRAAVADVILGGQIWSVLGVSAGDEVHVETLASGWAPGVGAHSAEGASAIEELDLVSGGALEIHASWSGVAGDSDMGSCDYRGNERAVHVVCSADGGLRCVAIETTRLRTWEHTACGDADPTAPVELEANVREGWSLEVALGPVSTVTPSPADTAAPPVSGDVSISTLLARDDLAWPARFEPIQLTAN